MNCDKEKKRKERKKCMITLFFMIIGLIFMGSVISFVLNALFHPIRTVKKIIMTIVWGAVALFILTLI